MEDDFKLLDSSEKFEEYIKMEMQEMREIAEVLKEISILTKKLLSDKKDKDQ